MSANTPEYTYVHSVGTAKRFNVNIKPMGPDYLSAQLNISLSEADEVFERRRQNQERSLPNLLGEFVIDNLGHGEFGLQMAHIEAIAAHTEVVGLETQVYGGYRAFNFLKNGTLFGPDSPLGAIRIRDRNQFHAAQSANWKEQAGYAKNNPFDHMTRGEIPAQSAPVILGFSVEMLDDAECVERINYDTAFWQPHEGKTIEDTVRIAYHRG
jgi:hypothetical protein